MAKKKDSVSVLDVVQGLSQAAANAHDGAYDDEGKLREVGLRREEGDALLDERVIDGFSIKFMGPILCINYHTPVKLKEVYAAGFESEMDQEGEIDIRVESASRVHSWATAYQMYKIGGIDEVTVIDEASEDRLEKSWKTFLDLGGWKGKRPKNDTRKKGSEVEK